MENEKNLSLLELKEGVIKELRGEVTTIESKMNAWKDENIGLTNRTKKEMHDILEERAHLQNELFSKDRHC